MIFIFLLVCAFIIIFQLYHFLSYELHVREQYVCRYTLLSAFSCFNAEMIDFCLVQSGRFLNSRALCIRSHKREVWRPFARNVVKCRYILPDERKDIECSTQYIIRDPLSQEKTQFTRRTIRARLNGLPDARAGGSIIYRSGMNPKIRRELQFASHRQISLRTAGDLHLLRMATSFSLRCCLREAALAIAGMKGHCADRAFTPVSVDPFPHLSNAELTHPSSTPIYRSK